MSESWLVLWIPLRSWVDSSSHCWSSRKTCNHWSCRISYSRSLHRLHSKKLRVIYFEQVNYSELDISLFEVVEKHSQAQESLVKFDEGIVGVQVFWDLRYFDDQVRHFVQRVLLFSEHVVSVIRQEVANFVVSLVADQLEPVRLGRYYFCVVIGHFGCDFLHQFVQLVQLFDHLCYCLF